MNVRVPSWIELMGRHAASGTLFLSASMRVTVSGDSAPIDKELTFWHGPNNRWRIESDGQIVYLQSPEATVLRDQDGEMRRQVADIVLPLLGPVSPFDLLGPNSNLLHMSEDVLIGPVSSVDVNGRQGWSVSVGTSASDAMVVVLDDDTGMTVRMESAGGDAVVSVAGIAVHRDLADSLFAWDGPLEDSTDKPRRAIRSDDDHRERLAILTAIDRALERRAEVFEVLTESAGPPEAVAAVAQLLDIEASGAEAVLAMQLRRFTLTERAMVSVERAELLRDPPPLD